MRPLWRIECMFSIDVPWNAMMVFMALPDSEYTDNQQTETVKICFWESFFLRLLVDVSSNENVTLKWAEIKWAEGSIDALNKNSPGSMPERKCLLLRLYHSYLSNSTQVANIDLYVERRVPVSLHASFHTTLSASPPPPPKPPTPPLHPHPPDPPHHRHC